MKLYCSKGSIFVKFHYGTTEPGHIKLSNKPAPSLPYVQCIVALDYDPKQEPIFAEALCSERDTFVKAQGRKIAFARALKAAGFSRSDRAVLWRQFLGTTNTLWRAANRR